MAFAILRVNKVAAKSDLEGLRSHGRRTDKSPHVDRSRSILNQHWSPSELKLSDPTDMVAAVEAVITRLGARTRKDAAVAANLFLGASSDFFETEAGFWDAEKTTKWFETNRGVLLERFPGQIACLRLDLDEATPHMDAIIVPLYEKHTRHTVSKVVSFRQVFGGDTRPAASAKMVALQDWYAEAMRPLGLERGVPKALSGIVGLTHQQYRRRQAQIEAEKVGVLDKLKQKIASLEAERRAAEVERMALRRDRMKVRALYDSLEDIVSLRNVFADSLELKRLEDGDEVSDSLVPRGM